jgi:hypothetical protein
MARAKKRKTKKKVIGICRLAGKNLVKNRTSAAGRGLATCRWKKPGAKAKQSRAMRAKNLSARMKRK